MKETTTTISAVSGMSTAGTISTTSAISSVGAIMHIPIGSLAKYEASDLYQALQEVTDELAQLKNAKEWLLSAIAIKYGEQFKVKRMRLEKDTGVVHLEDNGFRVSCDVPKKVEWNQQMLAKIAAEIITGGGKLEDYIDTYYTVPESKYSSWSGAIRGIFEPARMLKAGKPVYKLAKLDEFEPGAGLSKLEVAV